MGPSSAAEAWSDTIAKYIDRVEQLAISRMPSFLACKLYEERALPVLRYLAHFSDPPERMRHLEIRMLHRLLHLPMNSGSLHTFAHWHTKGGPKLGNASAMCAAVALRAAWTYRDLLMSLRTRLAEVAEAHAPALRLFQGEWSKDWDSQAVALFLLNKLEGDGDLALRFLRRGRCQPRGRLAKKIALGRSCVSAAVALGARESPPASIEQFFYAEIVRT